MEENFAEKIIMENEFLETQKKALKDNIRIWTGVLIYLLVVGLILCLLLYGFLMLIMFVIDLIFLLKTKELLKRVENGEAGVKEIYEFYENVRKRTGTLLAFNLTCGGVIGVIGSISDNKVSIDGMKKGEKILGDDYWNERVAKDPNAKLKYCIYCKRNKTKASFHLYRMSDGVICNNCLSKYSSMLPKRAENPMFLPPTKITHYTKPESTIGGLSLKDLEDRFEYLKKNQEDYSDFAPTRVICDGCLELDETNSLFRIATASEFDSAKAGVASGLVHPYSAIKGIAYEMIYEYAPPNEDGNGRWNYMFCNSIILAIDNPYLGEETFTLKELKGKKFESYQNIQIKYAEQTVKELQEIFNAPVMEKRILYR